MKAPRHSARRTSSLGTVAPPLAIVTILLAGALESAEVIKTRWCGGASSPLPDTSSLRDASLIDDGCAIRSWAGKRDRRGTLPQPHPRLPISALPYSDLPVPGNLPRATRS